MVEVLPDLDFDYLKSRQNAVMYIHPKNLKWAWLLRHATRPKLVCCEAWWLRSKNTVSRCVQWDRRLYAHHSLVAKQPNAIKYSPSAERVYNLKTYASYGVLPSVGLPRSLLQATNEIQKNGNQAVSSLNEEPTSLVTKEGLSDNLNLKPDNIANTYIDALFRHGKNVS